MITNFSNFWRHTLPGLLILSISYFGLNFCRTLPEGVTQTEEPSVFPFSTALSIGIEGSDVSLMCKYISGNNTVLQWTKNGEQLNLSLPLYNVKNGMASERIEGRVVNVQYQNLTILNVSFASQGYYGCHLRNETYQTKVVETSLKLQASSITQTTITTTQDYLVTGIAHGRIQMEFFEGNNIPSFSVSSESRFARLLSSEVGQFLKNNKFPAPRLTPVVHVSNHSNEKSLIAVVAIYQSLQKGNESGTVIELCQFLSREVLNGSKLEIDRYSLRKTQSTSYDCCFPVTESLRRSQPTKWPLTRAGRTAVQNCPSVEGEGTPKETATRKCTFRVSQDIRKGAQWQRTNNTRCPNEGLEMIGKLQALQNLSVTEINARAIATSLSNLVEFAESFDIQEFDSAVNIIGNIVLAAIEDLELYRILLKGVSDLLNTASSVITEAQLSAKASSKFLQTLEDLMTLVPWRSHVRHLMLRQNNVGMMLGRFNAQSTTGVFIGSAENTGIELVGVNSLQDVKKGSIGIFLSNRLVHDTINRSGEAVLRISGFVFENSKLFVEINGSGLAGHREVSQNKVVSAVAQGVTIKDTTEPIYVFLPRSNTTANFLEVCSFWNGTENGGFGSWSSTGCTVYKKTNQTVICRCNHLTNFALLISPDPNVAPGINEKVLSIIAYIGCIISSACLILAVITLATTRHLRKSRPPKILLCLCISLLCTLLIFLLGAERRNPRLGCRIVAIMTHYFLISTFMWSAVEGVNLYMAFVKVFGIHVSKFMLKAAFVGYGVPAIVVGTAAAFRFKEDYGAGDYCVVTGPTLYFAWILPAALVVAVNFVVLILVVRSLRLSNAIKTKDTHVDLKVQARVSFSCAFLMGLCWVFGMIAVGDTRLAFQYIFSILCAFQGMFIFIFQCALNKEIQKEWIRWYAWLMREKSFGTTSYPPRRRSKAKKTETDWQFSSRDPQITHHQSTTSLPLSDTTSIQN